MRMDLYIKVWRKEQEILAQVHVHVLSCVDSVGVKVLVEGGRGKSCSFTL